MKLLTFDEGGVAQPGVMVSDHEFLPISSVDNPELGSMQTIIETAENSLPAIQSQTQHPATTPLAVDDVSLLSPLPVPVQIRDCLCFLDHMRNASRAGIASRGGDPDEYQIPPEFLEAPRYWYQNRLNVIGHDADVQWPPGCDFLDFELELGIVIGKAGRDIDPDDALDHIFGYTVFNDVSARDLQAPEMRTGLGPGKGKDFDTGNAIGPVITTADEVEIADVAMTARLNGEIITRGSTALMDFPVPELIAHVSKNLTLYPGEILLSGTVTGGCLLELGRALSPGDVTELEVAGIGVLRNRYVRS